MTEMRIAFERRKKSGNHEERVHRDDTGNNRLILGETPNRMHLLRTSDISSGSLTGSLIRLMAEQGIRS
jgi:hypothetical protein